MVLESGLIDGRLVVAEQVIGKCGHGWIQAHLPLDMSIVGIGNELSISPGVAANNYHDGNVLVSSGRFSGLDVGLGGFFDCAWGPVNLDR